MQQQTADGIRNGKAIAWCRVVGQYLDAGLDPEPAITGSADEAIIDGRLVERPKGYEAAFRAYVASRRKRNEPTPAPTAPVAALTPVRSEIPGAPIRPIHRPLGLSVDDFTPHYTAEDMRVELARLVRINAR